jgi:hypothetical protein
MNSTPRLANAALHVIAGFSSVLLIAATTGHSPRIQFQHHPISFVLETDETVTRHVPATMAGGVAVFDYNQDGRPDIFFTNGARIDTLHKDFPKYSNRLFRNDGNGSFTDVTQAAGLAGTGYDIGVAVGDYDNDGFPDLFVAGVHHNALYHNNRDGTFSTTTTATAPSLTSPLKPGLMERVVDLRLPGRWAQPGSMSTETAYWISSL